MNHVFSISWAYLTVICHSIPLYWERSRTRRPTVNDVIKSHPISQPAVPQREGDGGDEDARADFYEPGKNRSNSLGCTPLHGFRRDKRTSLSGLIALATLLVDSHLTDPRLMSSDFSIRIERSLAFVLHYLNTPCSRSSILTPSVNCRKFAFHLENCVMLPENVTKSLLRSLHCSCQSRKYNVLQVTSNDTITGCRLNKVCWLAVNVDADDLRLCGLPFLVGTKDMVCHQLSGEPKYLDLS